MFLLFSSGYDPSQVISQLKKSGVEVQKEENGLRLTGATYRIDSAWLKEQPGVQAVIRLTDPAPLASRQGKGDSIVQVGDARFGGGNFSVIAGPCAVESKEVIAACAATVKENGAQILRGGAFKPRTSPYQYQGLGREGLNLLKEAGEQYDLPVVTELMCAEDCETLSPQVDLVQIGARNMQNYPLLRAAGKLKQPVLLKRGFCSSEDEWLLSAEYILDAGNPNVILCERGIRTFESAQRFTLDLGAVAAMKRRTHLPVIVDPSHAAGCAALVPPLALAAVCAGADGLMLEIHPDPAHALCDGIQALSCKQFGDLMTEITALRRHLSGRE